MKPPALIPRVCPEYKKIPVFTTNSRKTFLYFTHNIKLVKLPIYYEMLFRVKAVYHQKFQKSYERVTNVCVRL